MANALVEVSFVEAIGGIAIEDGADTQRAETLIDAVSDLLRERCAATWDATTVPASIAIVIAQIVAEAMQVTPSESASLKAEQIGDYRVEYARASARLFDLTPYAAVIGDHRVTAGSVVAGVPLDGVVYIDEDDEGVWPW